MHLSHQPVEVVKNTLTRTSTWRFKKCFSISPATATALSKKRHALRSHTTPRWMSTALMASSHTPETMTSLRQAPQRFNPRTMSQNQHPHKTMMAATAVTTAKPPQRRDKRQEVDCGDLCFDHCVSKQRPASSQTRPPSPGSVLKDVVNSEADRELQVNMGQRISRQKRGAVCRPWRCRRALISWRTCFGLHYKRSWKTFHSAYP